MPELDMWLSFYKERSAISGSNDGNLANKSNEDILKGFGL